MFCFLALFVLSILSIFSATHRKLAKEALDCVLRRVTFRPCTADFKEKIKGKIIAKLIDRRPFIARMFNRHFELMSWIFFILMIASTVWFARGLYNYYLYGNCQGENQTGFCLFDPTGENSKVSPVEQTCSVEPPKITDLNLSKVNLQDFPSINNNSENNIVFIGCYACDYSRTAYPVIKELVDKKNTNFTFIHFPAKGDTTKLSEYDYCAKKLNMNLFWDFNYSIFQAPIAKLTDYSYISSLAADVGYDANAMDQCVQATSTALIIQKQIEDIKSTNIYGTPTVFINGEPSVGPKPYRVYKRMLK